MGAFDQVSPGQPIDGSPPTRADWINAVSRATAKLQNEQALGKAGKQELPLRRHDTWVKIRNQVSYSAQAGQSPQPVDLLRGHVVQLGDYLLTDFDPRQLWFEGKLYDTDRSSRVAILRTAAQENDIVKADLIGVAVARVNVTDIAHGFAAPDDGKYVLKSASSGEIEILSPIDSTGDQEVAVLIGAAGTGGGDVKMAVGKASELIPQATEMGGNRTPGTGNVAIVIGEDEGNWQNWSLVPLPEDTYLVAVSIDGNMVIVAAFC